MTRLILSRGEAIWIFVFLSVFLTGGPDFANSHANASALRNSCTAIFETFLHPHYTARSPRDIPFLRVMTFNVRNLFHDVDISADYSNGRRSGLAGVKQRRQKVAALILSILPDVISLQEIKDYERLEKYAANELKTLYRPFLVEGNDHGDHIGFLVRSDLPFHIEIESHRHLTWQDPRDGAVVPLFSRDLPALIFRRSDQMHGEAPSKPVLIVLGNHSKSKGMGRNKRFYSKDHESNQRRTVQHETLAEIVARYQERFGEDMPILAAGDFNTDVRFAPEAAPIKTRLVDSFDVSNTRYGERVSYSFHPRGRPSLWGQYDAIFMSPSLSPYLLRAQILRYMDEAGRIKPLPKSNEERNRNLSDHHPVIIEFLTHGIFPEAHAHRGSDKVH